MAEAPKIRIPDQFIPGIKYISLLSEDNINSVYEALRQIPNGVTRKKYLKFFEDNCNVDNSSEIGNAIFSFGGLISEPDLLIEDIADRLSSSFEVISQGRGEEVTEEQIGILNNRLRYILLLSENLKAIYEVYELLHEQNSVLNIDLISKTNLIFDNNLKGKHGFIFHTLKIEYREEHKKKSGFFALDINDLKKLKLKIEQAIEKQENIILSNSELINFIDISE